MGADQAPPGAEVWHRWIGGGRRRGRCLAQRHRKALPGAETDPPGRLSADQIAYRFGPIGLRALRLCRGDESPLRPRPPFEELEVSLELPEGCAGPQLDRALDLLIGRLLAKPERKAPTFITVRLSANLVGGGSWSVEQGVGRPAASASAIRAPLGLRLAGLPSPASSLQLRVPRSRPSGPSVMVGVSAGRPQS